ncbi:hypothetical protein [Paenibacillus elgii]|uniref:hypothetical protein n=1 Tax=Paenibacillus elgii TaxID=189691 RepID=UPI000248C7D1|nr:hypothetical protein [Paenibacillus elgii]
MKNILWESEISHRTKDGVRYWDDGMEMELVYTIETTRNDEYVKNDYSNVYKRECNSLNEVFYIFNEWQNAGYNENEKRSCAALIQKEMEKSEIEPEFTVIDVYPVFMFPNPKGASWHIEKDGQIIAKGNGVFSVNEYDWENKEKSAAEQKAEKLIAFINKIEKVLKNADALQSEVVTVEKKVIKPVEKANKAINVNDILSFSYHGHYWIVLDVYTFGEQVRVTYELLGSGKRGYKRVNNSKRYYQPLMRLQQEMNEGKVKVYTLQEVTEYQEKTVFKKTARKQTIVDAPAIETSEKIENEEYTYENEEQTKGETNTYNNEQANNEVTLNINNEKNGIEIKFNHKPSQSIIDGLKENGFRWSSYNSVWWAKQTPERLKFATMFIEAFNSISQEEPEANVSEIVYGAQETTNESNTETAEQDNVIYHNFGKVEGQEEETQTSMFDDIVSKFDNIEITAEQKIATDDLEYCMEQEDIYKDMISAYNSFYNRLLEISEKSRIHGQKFGKKNGGFFHEQNTVATYNTMKSYDYEKTIKDLRNSFVSYICSYFEKKYSITINNEQIAKKYDEAITYHNILDEIMIQLDGFNFTEKAERELKEKVKKIVMNSDKTSIKNNKLIINAWFVRHDSIWKRYTINGDRCKEVFTALQHYDNGSIKGNEELNSKYVGYQNENNQDNYERYEPQTLTKVKSIKLLKNGKMEIEFTSNQQATRFASEYCGYNQKSA